MQQELTALQPELVRTSAETDEMMVKIEKETVEVDAKKELVAADEKVANEATATAQDIKVQDNGMKIICIHSYGLTNRKERKQNKQVINNNYKISQRVQQPDY